MPYTIHFNAMLMDGEAGPEPVLRYLQLGIVDEHGYSGVVLDYCGGGAWDDVYYVHGERVEPEAVAPDDEEAWDELDGDDYDTYLSCRYPGLVEAIAAAGAPLYAYRDGPDGAFPVALPALLARQATADDETAVDQLISSPLSLLAPVEGHHTSFE